MLRGYGTYMLCVDLAKGKNLRGRYCVLLGLTSLYILFLFSLKAASLLVHPVWEYLLYIWSQITGYSGHGILCFLNLKLPSIHTQDDNKITTDITSDIST